MDPAALTTGAVSYESESVALQQAAGEDEYSPVVAGTNTSIRRLLLCACHVRPPTGIPRPRQLLCSGKRPKAPTQREGSTAQVTRRR